MKKIEILSPSGSMDSAFAAIKAGCDAIYLGGKMFGARSFANNFTDEELVKIIKLAHFYGIKVYVTCNILIYDKEVSKFLDYVRFLHQNNVDALIVQDLGMIDLIRKKFPNLELHGSTQMHIHNLEGALVAKKLGLKRIVVARETPLEVIKEIKEKTKLDIEIFVHGALCVSYSGMCLFARSIGPRSGNRGTCSGCCRLPYDIVNPQGEILNKGKYPLSMKDLNTLEYLDKLIESGVDSFKIEGRMKSPSYVYTVTKLYHDTRDNYLKTNKIDINRDDSNDLKTIFNREYTKGYLLNENNNEVINMNSSNHQGTLLGRVLKYNKNFVTIKLEENLSIHDGIRIGSDYGLIVNEFYKDQKKVYEAFKGDIITLKVNKEFRKNELVVKTLSHKIEEKVSNIIKDNRKVPITFKLEVLKDKPVKLNVSDEIDCLELLGSLPNIALKRQVTKEELKEKLEKINNTNYNLEEIEIELDDNLFIPISMINNLKREILDKLTDVRINRFKKDFVENDYKIDVPEFKKEESNSLLTNNKNDLSDKYKYIYSEVLDNCIKKLPKVINNYSNYLDNQQYLVVEIGGLSLKNIVTDYSLNVTNSYTVAFLHSIGVKRVTLSLELVDKQIEDLINSYLERYKKRPNLELIVLTKMEVMVLKFKYSEYFKQDVRYLVDRFNNKYRVLEKNNLTYIYDYKKYQKDNLEKYYQMGINCLRFEDYE